MAALNFVLDARLYPVLPQPWASLSLSAGIHLSVLNNSYARMYL
jgi:hypothetical protein